MFNPQLKSTITDSKAFAAFLTPAKKISIADVEQALRNHYQGIAHAPYANSNPKESYRPISVFRIQEPHIIQIRANLPQTIGKVEYIAFGMPTLDIYVPYYQRIEHYLPGYEKGGDHASDDAVSGRFRKLQTMVMQDYNAYAPDVQRAYQAFEQQTAQRQQRMEQEYRQRYTSQQKKAQQLLQQFKEQTMQDARTLTDQLTSQVVTKMTHDTDVKYHVEGA